jgi:hypothetical protein
MKLMTNFAVLNNRLSAPRLMRGEVRVKDVEI